MNHRKSFTEGVSLWRAEFGGDHMPQSGQANCHAGSYTTVEADIVNDLYQETRVGVLAHRQYCKFSNP